MQRKRNELAMKNRASPWMRVSVFTHVLNHKVHRKASRHCDRELWNRIRFNDRSIFAAAV